LQIAENHKDVYISEGTRVLINKKVPYEEYISNC